MRTKALFFILPLWFMVATTHAYAVTYTTSVTPPITPSIDLNWNDVLNNLSSPFQNFSRSLQSAANTPIENFTFSTSGISQSVSSNAQGLLDRFDAWLFNIAGFHIAAIFHFMIGIVEWTLGLLKRAIDWLFSLAHLN